MQSPDLRLRLRNETATAHKNLEDLLNIMSPSLDSERYTHVLEGFARLHASLEGRLHELRELPFAAEYLAERRKLPWLAADLAACALAPAIEREAPDLSWITTEPELLGALYVIEGSTLGGQVVSRHLHSIPSIASTRYFESYGPDTGRNWQKFTALLSTRPPAEHDTIVASADRMFRTIATALS
jgi:heme oxygenase